MKVRINKITRNSLVDGPGKRNVVFFQGCSIHCEGCQNKHLWDADGGHLFDVNVIARELLMETNLVTISGGEPFQQPDGLLALLAEIKHYRPQAKTLVYTGYKFETLLSDYPEHMEYIDILVDGPFIAELDDPLIMWMGSRNQRAIDVPTSLFVDRTMTIWWGVPELILDTNGTVFGPIGIIDDFQGAGQIKETRRCGQTK